MEFYMLASGKSGDIEISIDHDKKNKVYMNVDTKDLFMYFLLEVEEDKILKAIISYLKNDGEIVWKGSEHITLGKFGEFRVELINDIEFDDRAALVAINRSAKASMRYELNKQNFIEACKIALEDL